MVEKQIILTNYFTGKRDPQRGGHNQFEPDKFDNIKGWYESLINNDLYGIIFHDQLSDTFIDRYSNGNVCFITYRLKRTYSLNDDRFFCWYEWLKQHEEVATVFCTDLFDVDFFGNPFNLMNPQRYDLYCGKDKEDAKTRNWLNTRMKWAYGKDFHDDKIIYNAGIIGGTRLNILRLFKKMIHDFEKAKLARLKRKNMNMGVFNKCVNELFPQNRIMSGYPLNSLYKQYEKEGDFCIRHK